MVDMAHIAGLVAAGLHQNPVPYADLKSKKFVVSVVLFNDLKKKLYELHEKYEKYKKH